MTCGRPSRQLCCRKFCLCGTLRPRHKALPFCVCAADAYTFHHLKPLFLLTGKDNKPSPSRFKEIFRRSITQSNIYHSQEAFFMSQVEPMKNRSRSPLGILPKDLFLVLVQGAKRHISTGLQQGFQSVRCPHLVLVDVRNPGSLDQHPQRVISGCD